MPLIIMQNILSIVQFLSPLYVECRWQVNIFFFQKFKIQIFIDMAYLDLAWKIYSNKYKQASFWSEDSWNSP